eukprot:215288_1
MSTLLATYIAAHNINLKICSDNGTHMYSMSLPLAVGREYSSLIEDAVMYGHYLDESSQNITLPIFDSTLKPDILHCLFPRQLFDIDAIDLELDMFGLSFDVWRTVDSFGDIIIASIGINNYLKAKISSNELIVGNTNISSDCVWNINIVSNDDNQPIHVQFKNAKTGKYLRFIED